MKKILYNSKINNKRLTIKADTYNWIVMYGSLRVNNRDFEKNIFPPEAALRLIIKN